MPVRRGKSNRVPGQGQGAAKTRLVNIEHLEKQARALQLRKAGMTYREIARQLGVGGESHNPGASYKLVREAMRAIVAEPATDVLELELQRLDQLLQSVWGTALRLVPEGQPRPSVEEQLKAVDRVLAIMKRRSNFLGLDAPERQEHSADEKLQRALDRLTEAANRRREREGQPLLPVPAPSRGAGPS